MRPNVLTSVMYVFGFGALSLVVRFVVWQYIFAEPLGQINKTLTKQFSDVSRAMDEAPPQDYSTRDGYKSDAEWEQTAFRQPVHSVKKPDGTDDPDAAATKQVVPEVPPSSWVLFVTTDSDGNRTMHGRLSLSDPDGKPLLAIDLSQPQPAIGDIGATAQLSFAAVNSASCGGADGLILRFDAGPPVRYAAKGVWGDRKCSVSVPDFPHFRTALVNASTLSVRLAKGTAMTQEIPAPIGGLSWTP